MKGKRDWVVRDSLKGTASDEASIGLAPSIGSDFNKETKKEKNVFSRFIV